MLFDYLANEVLQDVPTPQDPQSFEFYWQPENIITKEIYGD